MVDPTENVLALVEAAVRRQDDLRLQESTHLRDMLTVRSEFEEKFRAQETNHTQHTMTLRADYDRRLAIQEAARIDAIRAVDIAAVSRAAEVSAVQASTLASQVATAAEAMRNQVAAAAAAAASALATALEPIQKSIDDLRKAQYEAQGSKYQQIESKDTGQWTVMAAIGVVGILLVIVQVVLHFIK